jgi:hypothetical protein
VDDCGIGVKFLARMKVFAASGLAVVPA